MSEFFLPSFVISMNESRRAPLINQLAKDPFYDIQIQPGVKGDTFLNSKDFCSQTSFKFLVGREMWSGELGCTLAHYYALQAFINLPDKWALILEDNARTYSFSSKKTRQLLEFLTIHPVFSNSPTVVQLHTAQDRLSIGSLVGRLGELELCDSYRLLGPTKAYLVNRYAAELAIARSLPVRTPPDFPSWFSLTHFLVPNSDIFGVEENLKSEIGPKRSSIVLRRNSSRLRILARKLLTIVGFLTGLEALLYRVFMGKDFYFPVIIFRRLLKLVTLQKKSVIRESPLYVDSHFLFTIHERLIKNKGGIFLKH